MGDWRDIVPEERFAAEFKRMAAEAEAMNRKPGVLNVAHVNAQGETVPGDGVDCPKCLNRGLVYGVRYFPGQGASLGVMACGCNTQRAAVKRLRESGLADSVKRYTFENFQAIEPWQRAMLETAQKYAEQGAKDGAWMFFGGNPGAGKTHLATAIVGKLIRELDVCYSVWPQMAQALKACVMDDEAYDRQMKRYQRAQVLLLDDFLKPGRDRKGNEEGASAADMRLAFDLLNARYLNRLPTIISSEWHIGELAEMDEATASRIYEQCGEYVVNIKRAAGRNWRFRNMKMV